jgi:hypothetical protein
MPAHCSCWRWILHLQCKHLITSHKCLFELRYALCRASCGQLLVCKAHRHMITSNQLYLPAASHTAFEQPCKSTGVPDRNHEAYFLYCRLCVHVCTLAFVCVWIVIRLNLSKVRFLFLPVGNVTGSLIITVLYFRVISTQNCNTKENHVLDIILQLSFKSFFNSSEYFASYI